MQGTNLDSLMMDFQVLRLGIKKSNIEGECYIENIVLLRIKKLKLALAVFLTIITAGIFLLLLRWIFKLRVKFLYKEVQNVQQASHILIKNSDYTQTIESIEIVNLNLEQFENDRSVEGVYSFQNRKLRYIYQEDDSQYSYFVALEYPVCTQTLSSLREKSFLDFQQAIVHKEAYGKCEKVIDIPSLPLYLFREMTTPFFFLQYISIVLWIFEDYISFTVIMFSVSVAIVILNYLLMRISLSKIQKMAHTTETITVLRKDSVDSFRESLKINSIESKDIVVGDIILLQDKQILPCDCVLISGEALMNEVSLTGESLPIPKYYLPNTNEKFSYAKEFKKYVLFEGTEIFQCKGDENKQVLAKVIRVGFASFKGQILRSVLYPKPVKFEFYTNSMKYILGLLAVVLAIYFSRIYQMYKLDFPAQFYVYRFFDTVTWIIPPFLPIFVSFSQTLALMRLRIYGILGIDPQKTFQSGKVTHMCFDKTGTLTENGMEMNGYYNENLDQLITSSQIQGTRGQNSILQHKLFATCHGAYLINDELVGDMLDLEMVKFSGYNIANVEEDINIKFKASHPQVQDELHVIRMFEFSSDLQRMSCIAFDVSNSQYYFFLKGAPEKVMEHCSQATIPSNFSALQNKLSLKGLRLIAMAYKEIRSREEGLSSTLDKLEADLKFLGFIILENKLKADTAEAIKSLREAQIECKIISGDNPLTTLQAGIESGVLDGSQRIYYIDTEYQELKIFQVENEQIQGYIHESPSKLQQLKSLILNEEQIVITGKVLDFFYTYIKNANNGYAPQHITSESSIDDYISNDKSINISRGSAYANKFDLTNALILKTAVFSRFRPEQKRIIIEILQNQGFKVGMIGDGANDCAAIKQGDIGISFASTDAAFSAPFSSSNQSIKCVERILLEGRCTMTVNIEIFRTIVTQNVMKYIGVMVLLQEAQNFGGFQYTYLSFMCGMPLLVFLALSAPYKKLQPYTPDDKFQGLSSSLSMYTQFIVFGGAFIIGYWILVSQSWHVVTKELDEDNGLKIYNMSGELNSVIFLMINFFYMFSCLSFYISFPFKQIVLKNFFLFPFVLLSTAYGIVMIVKPQYCLSGLLISETLDDHEGTLILILVVAVAASLIVLAIEELAIKRYFGPKKIKQQI